MVAASPTTQARHVYRGAEWHRQSVSDGTTTTSFLYDGSDVVGDYVGGSVSRTYVTPFLDQNLSVSDVGSGETLWYSQDGLGSVRTLTDGAGAVKNAYDYEAFGSPYGPGTNVTFAQRYTYTGREKSGVAGAPMYYRNRSYSPTLGRFGRRDPAGYPNNVQGNLYDYVYGNPASYIDPFGLDTDPWSIGDGSGRTRGFWNWKIQGMKEAVMKCRKYCASIKKPRYVFYTAQLGKLLSSSKAFRSEKVVTNKLYSTTEWGMSTIVGAGHWKVWKQLTRTEVRFWHHLSAELKCVCCQAIIDDRCICKHEKEMTLYYDAVGATTWNNKWIDAGREWIEGPIRRFGSEMVTRIGGGGNILKERLKGEVGGDSGSGTGGEPLADTLRRGMEPWYAD